ncbi:ras-related protein rab-7l1 [Plakobranchus ocellatus]|uniref:Ras-related protein rab-7l1 n=1 Tax=Plakobranchus ocellatus TaxID=259542 RepID=A0AAV4BVT6_9GAST|nr:ras-related protein rab-7l1 [Plakobranchus ocellatus]
MVIVIGDTLVGKTSFIHRYVNNGFRVDYKSTIGVDFAIKQVVTSSNKNIKIQLWDIAGQERFTYLTRAYYKDARGCVLMFDVGSAASFHSVRKWKADLDSKVRTDNGSLLPCILVANKCDKVPAVVSDTEIQLMCEELFFVGWTKVSVKDGTMVKESMSYLLDTVLGLSPRSPNIHSNSISLSAKTQEENSKKDQRKSCSC